MEGFYDVTLAEELQKDGSVTWYAEHPALAGCHAVGATQEEALANLDRSREAWLAWAQKHDVSIRADALRESPSISVQYAARPNQRQTAYREAGSDVETTVIPGVAA